MFSEATGTNPAKINPSNPMHPGPDKLTFDSTWKLNLNAHFLYGTISFQKVVCRVFSHDVTAVSQNNKTAAMLVSQTNPVGVELFSYANTFFCSNKFAEMLAMWVKTLYKLTSIMKERSEMSSLIPKLLYIWLVRTKLLRVLHSVQNKGEQKFGST